MLQLSPCHCSSLKALLWFVAPSSSSTVIITLSFKHFMHIFSELLDRKPKPKPIGLDFQVLRKTEPEPTLLGTSLRSLNERSSVPSESLFTFNVRDHYRMLKEQSRLKQGNSSQPKSNKLDSGTSLTKMALRDSKGSKTSLKFPDTKEVFLGVSFKEQSVVENREPLPSSLASPKSREPPNLRNGESVYRGGVKSPTTSPPVSRLRLLEHEIKGLSRP